MKTKILILGCLLLTILSLVSCSSNVNVGNYITVTNLTLTKKELRYSDVENKKGFEGGTYGISYYINLKARSVASFNVYFYTGLWDKTNDDVTHRFISIGSSDIISQSQDSRDTYVHYDKEFEADAETLTMYIVIVRQDKEGYYKTLAYVKVVESQMIDITIKGDLI